MPIPKIIHYCWFGGNPLPELTVKCIDSWTKYCPEYEIKRWDESNFDINLNDYVKEAYEAKKWAFVSDVARLYAITTYGGIYMDTDVEVLKSLDSILEYDAVTGFESDEMITTGLMACIKNHPMFLEFLQEYSDKHFVNSDGSFDLTTNVTRITNTCFKYGFVPNNTFQTINNLTLLPKDYLCPKDYKTKKINITENSLTIHHFDGSWLSDEQIYERDKCTALCKIMPLRAAQRTAKVLTTCKFEGIRGVFNLVNRKFFHKKAKN